MRAKKWAMVLWILFSTLGIVYAGSPVWEVSNGTTRLFIGGTIHVLGQNDYPLPPAFDRAYKNSQTLVFETDIAQTQDPEFAKTLMGQMVYTDNKNLKTLLTPKTFDDLARFAGERGIPMEVLTPFKPGMVMVFLTLAEIERLGVAGIGVDEFYFKKATADQRQMKFLEPPMDQIQFLAKIGEGKENQMIAYILEDIGKLPDLLPIMKKAWRSGNNELMYQQTLAPLKKEYPDLYQTIMVKRNRAWLPVIQKMMTTPEVEFILVGTAHLAGDQGLISLLEKKGYKAINQ
ncbi:MAG: TraB/GumN family protein [Desulfobacter sp.]|nr:TraB/GumN family protein [Desulfobacter sp.]WDP87665.1 MAG: TraB/GumN family protein [Desulfobacter sp.]